jgi:hypothetical protein
MLALDHRLLLTRRLGRAGSDGPAASEYRIALARLNDSIRRVTGARVLVDSSKAPSYALALARLEDVELSLVHVVRDSRATAFSRLRDPDPVGTGLAGSALLWDAWNLLTERWLAAGPRFLRVRYEDFAMNPRATIERIVEAVGEAAVDGPVARDGRAVLSRNHSVAGNAARFRAGEVQILRDDLWERSLPRRHRVLVTALTWPVLRRYGYGLSDDGPMRTADGLALPTAIKKS